MSDILLLNNVSFKEKSCGLQFADAALFFAKAALGYQNITLEKEERTHSVTNIFIRVICGLLAFTVLLPVTLTGLVVKYCLQNEQTRAVENYRSRRLPFHKKKELPKDPTKLKGPYSVSSQRTANPKINPVPRPSTIAREPSFQIDPITLQPKPDTLKSNGNSALSLSFVPAPEFRPVPEPSQLPRARSDSKREAAFHIDPLTIQPRPVVASSPRNSNASSIQPSQEVRPVQEAPRDSFQPYKMQVSFLGNNQKADKSFDIDNLEAEKRCLEEISSYVNGQHKIVQLSNPEGNWNYMEWRDDRKFKAFDALFEMIDRNFDTKLTSDPTSREILGLYTIVKPKLVKEEALEDGRVRNSYLSGVVEEFQIKETHTLWGSGASYFFGTRRYPDGSIEKGCFNMHSTKSLQKGYLFRAGKYTFIQPDKIVSGSNSLNLYFANLPREDGSTFLGVVQNEDRFSSQFTIYDAETPIDVLCKLVLDELYCTDYKDGKKFGIIPALFSHPQNTINPNDLLKLLLTPNAEGTPPIFKIVDADALNEVLKLAKQCGVNIDLHFVDPVTKHTLLTKWAGKGETDLIKTMLSLDPTVIRQKTPEGRSSYTVALLKNEWAEAEVLFQAMESERVPLTIEEIWLRRTFSNDCAFTDDEFRVVDPKFQLEIYSLANANCQMELVEKLNRLGMGAGETMLVKAPHILSFHMDVIQVKKTLGDFLENLRKEGLLLTEEEFSSKDKDSYFCKGFDIGRILGRNYIESTAKSLGCERIKAPKKMAVINKEANSIQLTVAANRHLDADGNVQIFAEKIKGCNRFATREEMEQLVQVLFATGYTDIHKGNFIIAEDGIYFIDTEFTNFSSPGLDPNNRSPMMWQLLGFVKPEDQEWLKELLNKKIAETNNREEGKEPPHSIKDLRKKFGFTKDRSFAFPLPSSAR